MANKEKIDIKRSDQFQEVDDELTRAMAELDSTIERVSLVFQAEADPGAEDAELPAAAGARAEAEPPAGGAAAASDPAESGSDNGGQ